MQPSALIAARLARLLPIVAVLSSLLPAQFPSDAEVATQLRNDGVLEIRFPRQTRGEKVWDGATNSWYWQRGVVVVRSAKLKQYPKATVEIGGLARYFITGERVSYQKFLVTWNEYKGIPAPTHADTVKMLRQRLQQFVGNYRYNKIVGKVEDLGVAADHRTRWHTPHSFSINVSCRYKMIVSYTEVEAKQATFRVRLYRDAFGKPWREKIVSTLAAEKSLGQTRHDADEVRSMPTLGSTDAAQRALAAKAALPKVELPVFKSDADVFRYVYQLLRTGNAGQLEAALSKFLAPYHYSDQAKGVLNAHGTRFVQKVIERTLRGKSSYVENYAPEMQVKRQQRGMVELWNRTRQVKTRIAVREFEDPATGDKSWRLTALDPWTLWRPADIARLRRLAKTGGQ